MNEKRDFFSFLNRREDPRTLIDFDFIVLNLVGVTNLNNKFF